MIFGNYLERKHIDNLATSWQYKPNNAYKYLYYWEEEYCNRMADYSERGLKWNAYIQDWIRPIAKYTNSWAC